MKCEKCNKEHDGQFGSGRFCSRSCANSKYHSKELRELKSKINKEIFKNNPEIFRRFKGHSKEALRKMAPKISKTLTTHGLSTMKRKLKGLPCEKCNKENAFMHHKDGNVYNNKKENLELLCRSCHVKEHYKIGTKTGIMGHKTVNILNYDAFIA